MTSDSIHITEKSLTQGSLSSLNSEFPVFFLNCTSLLEAILRKAERAAALNSKLNNSKFEGGKFFWSCVSLGEENSESLSKSISKPKTLNFYL